MQFRDPVADGGSISGIDPQSIKPGNAILVCYHRAVLTQQIAGAGTGDDVVCICTLGDSGPGVSIIQRVFQGKLYPLHDLAGGGLLADLNAAQNGMVLHGDGNLLIVHRAGNGVFVCIQQEACRGDFLPDEIGGLVTDTIGIDDLPGESQVAVCAGGCGFQHLHRAIRHALTQFKGGNQRCFHTCFLFVERYRSRPEGVLLAVLIDLAMLVDGHDPRLCQNRAGLPGDLLDGVGAVGQALAGAHAVFAGDDGIHHSPVPIRNRELGTGFRSGEMIHGVHDFLRDLNFAGDDFFRATSASFAGEAVVFLGGSYRKSLFPFLVQQVAGGSCDFFDGVGAHREDVPGLGVTVRIRGQFTNHTSGGNHFPVHNNRIGTGVDDLEFGTCQSCFALWGLSGNSIVLFNADRTEQPSINGFLHTPVAAGQLGEDRHGFCRPFVSCGGAILHDGTVQRLGDYGVTKRILHFRDLHCSKGKLANSGRRYIQGIAGIARCNVILVIPAPSICIGCKVPGTSRRTRPITVGVILPLEHRSGKGTVALRRGSILVHLGQHKGRIENRDIRYGDGIFTILDSTGVGLGV